MSKRFITKKQETILLLILTFRFINSKQIQQFLGHKDHRRINAWLKDLAEKHYIVREYKPVFGTLTKPAVCYLSLLGRQYIRNTLFFMDDKYLVRLRDDTKRSKSFKVKCQLIADFYLIIYVGKEKELVTSIEEIVKEGVTMKPKVLQFFTPAFFSELDFVLLAHLKPDAYVSKQTKTGIVHTCIFVLDAYIPRLMLHYLLKRIFQALDEETWEDDEVASLHLYFVCPNNMVIIYLRRLLSSFMESYYGSKPLMFHFATRNQLYKQKREKLTNTGWITVSSTDE